MFKKVDPILMTAPAGCTYNAARVQVGVPVYVLARDIAALELAGWSKVAPPKVKLKVTKKVEAES